MTTAAAPKSTSVWEDFIDIFVSPSQVFARRKGRGFIIPLIVVTIVIAALAIGTSPLMQPMYDAIWEQTSAQITSQNAQITAEQLSTIRGMQGKIITATMVVGTPIGIVFVGLLLWLVGKLFNSEQNVRDALMVSSYAFFPKILALVAAAVLALLLDPSSITSPYSLTLGLGRFVDNAANPALAAIVGRLDVFTIWVTVLLGVGLYVTGKVPRGKAAIAAVIVWVVGALPALYNGMKMMG